MEGALHGTWRLSYAEHLLTAFDESTQIRLESGDFLVGKATLRHRVEIEIAYVNVQIPTRGVESANGGPFGQVLIVIRPLAQAAFGDFQAVMTDHTSLLEQKRHSQRNQQNRDGQPSEQVAYRGETRAKQELQRGAVIPA